MTKTPRKNPAAIALGRLGGQAGSKAQNRARRENAQLGGRPGRVCIHCHEPVRGGHIDPKLDKTCGEHGWRWHQRADDPPPPSSNPIKLLKEAIAIIGAADHDATAVPVAKINDWLMRAKAVI